MNSFDVRIHLMYGNTSGVEQMYEFIEYMNSSSDDGNVLVRLETGCMNLVRTEMY